MDSVTQIVLGAAVAEAAGGRQFGRRAAMWGAVLGTLPDLDVFVPLGDAVRDFTYHRSASHSLIVLALLTPLIVWLIKKIHPTTAEHQQRWFMLVYLVLATHVLLDSFTVYGTQIFWPLLDTPMTWSTIFIIDPLYTLPLLIGVICVASMKRNQAAGHTANLIGLGLSTLYLSWTVGVKLHVDHIAQQNLHKQKIEHTNVMTISTPFNSLLWRVLVVNDNDYFEGFYSIFDGDVSVRFEKYPRSLELVKQIDSEWTVQRLRWFTKGFYSASLVDDFVVISDIRMGTEPDYVFSFKVGKFSNPHLVTVTPERMPVVRDYDRLRRMWHRIWDPLIKY